MIDVDPGAAASQAIGAHDANGDGKLSAVELAGIPGVLKWILLYDLDADSAVSESEISQRISKWQADNLGFRSLSANVTLNGSPLPNVHVTLTPEPYLSPAVKPATGITNQRGFASLSVAPDDLPEAIKRRGIRVSGVYPGTYKISLSHPQRSLPDRDKNGAPLGDEVARDTVDTSIDIELSSR